MTNWKYPSVGTARSQSSQILISPSPRPSQHWKKSEHTVHPDLGSAKALVRWNRDHLGWKSHGSNQTSAFTLNVCAFEVKTDCRLQLRHEWLFLFWCTRLLQAPGKCKCASTGLMTSLKPKSKFSRAISFFKCFLCTFFGFEHKLGPTEVFCHVSMKSVVVCIFWNRTPSILKNGTVLSMSRNELPKDETLVSTTEIHVSAFNSLHHSQFLCSLLLFLVLNFPLDFVVPLDVEVIGLNASLSDQFISHALIFRPRLVVLNYHLTTNNDICLTNHTLQTHLLSPDCRVSEVISWSIELLQRSSTCFI
jgi:hypothetical protein